MPAGFIRSFAKRLDGLCDLDVKEVEEGDVIDQGQALVALGDYHMRVGKDRRVHLDIGPLQHGVRPAVDPLIRTAANVYQSETIGVILTGMGKDGASGMKTIKEHGGATIAQDEATCTVFGMSKAAVEEGCVDKILPLSKIPKEIIRRCQT